MDLIAALLRSIDPQLTPSQSYQHLVKPQTSFNKVEEFNIRHARKKVARKAKDLTKFYEITGKIDGLKDCPVDLDQFLHVVSHIIDDPRTRQLLCSTEENMPVRNSLGEKPMTPLKPSSSTLSSTMDTTMMMEALPLRSPSVPRHASAPLHKTMSTISSLKGLNSSSEVSEPAKYVSDRAVLSFGDSIALRSFYGFYAAFDPDSDDFNARWPTPFALIMTNASNKRCRGIVSYSDTVVISDGSSYLGTDSSGNLFLSRSITDSKIKWTIVAVGSQNAGEPVHSFDTVFLKSCFATMLYCDPDGYLNCNCSDMSHPGLSWTMSKATIPYSPAWLEEDLITSALALHERRNGPDLFGLSHSVQERCLVRALQSALMVVPSDYIGLLLSPNPHFELLTSNALPTLQFQVERFLPTCNSCFIIRSEIKRCSRYEFGTVSQALMASIESVLEAFFVKVAQMDNATLQSMWFHLQDDLYKISQVHRLVCMVQNTTGGALLQKVHEFYISQGDSTTRELCYRLLSDSSVPYFSLLSSWIHFGIVNDPYDEFHIRIRSDLVREKVDRILNDSYWDERYIVRQEQLPSFLAPFSKEILLTGKYINVLRHCALNKMFLESRRQAASDAIFEFDSDKNSEVIHLAFQFSSQELLKVLLTETNLTGHLRCMSRYFLHGQGDFFTTFLDTAESELSRPAKSQSLVRLQALLDLALCSTQDDPLHEHIRCRLEKHTLIQKMNVIHALSQESFVDTSRLSMGPGIPEPEISGIEALTLDYDVSWPLSLILSKKAMTKYQLIFRHLFYIKHVDRQIGIVWKHQQRLRELSIGSTYSLALALRLRMTHFLQNLQFYLTFEVLEPNYRKLEALLSTGTLNTVDNVIDAHESFLDQCLKECLLTNHNILQCLMSLLASCLVFASNINTFFTSFEHEELMLVSNQNASKRRQRLSLLSSQARLAGQNEQYVEMISQFLAQFDEKLADMIDQLTERAVGLHESHMLNLCTRLDYNNYYRDRTSSKKTPD